MPKIEKLLDVMERLRDPKLGCPWDLKQTFSTIAPFTIEEAYEVAEAIARSDYDDLKEELGDLLFQVAFHSQLAKEEGLFEFGDVVEVIVSKMIRRHTHVFNDKSAESEGELTQAWEAHKIAERAAKGQVPNSLDHVPATLPALIRARKLQQQAAGVGFDWSVSTQVVDKLEEEIKEFKQAVKEGNFVATQAELGDILFTCVNLGRHLCIDPENALRNANNRFVNRFHVMKEIAESYEEELDGMSSEALDRLWELAKTHEKDE